MPSTAATSANLGSDAVTNGIRIRVNPQFIPVVAVASPVALTLTALEGAVKPGVEARFAAKLTTASGKPIAPEDLLIAHTRLLHLLVIDVLATCVALRIGPALQPALEQMKNNLRAKRYT